MFEILFLAFAITALVRLPKDVRRMRERKRSALPFGPEYQIPGMRPIARTGADVVLIDPQFAPKVTARASWFAS
jgi:hypothetical protein